MSPESIRDLHYRLRQDKDRITRGFNPDMAEVSALLHRPYVEGHEIEEAMRHWCKTRQPCQFGRAAASQGQIFFCVLRERDLGDGPSGDEAISEKNAAIWLDCFVGYHPGSECPHSFHATFSKCSEHLSMQPNVQSAVASHPNRTAQYALGGITSLDEIDDRSVIGFKE